MTRKVFCATLGCDKNLVDSEALLGRFAHAGIEPVSEPDTADIWVLNSCGFIDAARRDSEETLRDLIEHKEHRMLVVCGCWSQEHGDTIRERFPGVDVVAGVGQFERVVAACAGRPVSAEVKTGGPDVTAFRMADAPLVEDPMKVDYTGMLDRPLLTPPHMAFVKIGEGCNFNCSFCRIPMIRGKQRSRPVAEIEQEVRGLVERGVTEIQLVSQNTSDFGRDTGENLAALVTSLDGIDGLRWIRMLYLYPGLVTVEGLLDLLQLESVVPYLDLPIQHASDRLLRAMRRPGGSESNVEFFRSLRAERPDLVLRSTALLGFPGEEEEDVEQLADFLSEVEFDHLGTYRYSPETGTDSERLGNRVSDEVILDRESLIMDVQSEISMRRQESRLGREFEIVIDEVHADPLGDGAADAGVPELAESLADGQWVGEREQQGAAGVLDRRQPLAVGRSEHFGYDLDGSILLPGDGLRPGERIRGRFVGATPYDVWAVPGAGND